MIEEAIRTETPGLNSLKELVSSGKLELVYIVSPPRCLSTAMEIAVTETADGQINEPFHSMRSASFDEGCQLLVDRYRGLAGEMQDKATIRLVVKDLIRHTGASDWTRLLGLSKEVIFMVREPSLQLYSLLKRRVNDRAEFNGDKLTEEQVIAGIPNVPLNRVIDDTWSRLGEVWERSQDCRPVVVSQLSFLQDPRGSLDRLSSYFKWSVPTERILSGWEKGAGQKFYIPEPKYHLDGRMVHSSAGAWLREAFNSRGFQPLDPKDDKPRPIGIYPESIKRYFLEQMLPTYIEMMMCSQNLSRPDFAEIEKANALYDINPIESYVLLQSYVGLSSGAEEVRLSLDYGLKARIQKDYSELAQELFELTKSKRAELLLAGKAS